MKLTRRTALSLSAAATAMSVAGVAPTFAAEGDTHSTEALMNVALPDRVLGDPDAPVTVIEYASPTCPHCAQFHVQTYPAFVEQYVDTGEVKFIVRPFIRNVLDAVVFMLAEAAGEDMYHEVVNTYFETQATWAGSETPRDAILAIAMDLGFTEESFEEALTNQELFEGMEAMREQALDEFDLTGTPTFYINGKQLSGAKTLEEMAAEVDPLLG